jgi:hypothetical protein
MFPYIAQGMVRTPLTELTVAMARHLHNPEPDQVVVRPVDERRNELYLQIRIETATPLNSFGEIALLHFASDELGECGPEFSGAVMR